MTNIGWDILISSTKPVGWDLSVVTKVIYVLVPVIGTVAMILAAIDPTFGPLLHATVVAVAIAGAYPMLETLWRRGRPSSAYSLRRASPSCSSRRSSRRP